MPSLKRNNSNNPEVGTVVPGSVNRGTLENMKFKLKCMLRKDTSTDMALIKELFNLLITDGYKLLWYDYANATTENNTSSLLFQTASNPLFGDQLTNGEKTAFTITDNFYTLHVTFESINPVDDGKKGKITYELSGTVIKVEASVV